jgi:hypothetical protein
MRFGDLAAQHQADARPAGIGGEERHEQVRRVRNPQPFILDGDFCVRAVARPSDPNAAADSMNSMPGSIKRAAQRGGAPGQALTGDPTPTTLKASWK